ncbi:fungal-specific transcription factor domain-containing protein [Dactylonectria estremocensis]|uniref:Fungal-specific transcription factor domain-containing protein n=1 Tax=Dactylonectria estremocensis TaxID=1079267 RepID=A0A9P9EWB7_9HYPO|nr:fungal-specific transcription factor domain-containing protein [Dactylonectria estremocensis]
MASHADTDMLNPDRRPVETSIGGISGKRKRAKYTARACQYCQRRKIKCLGGVPCRPCLSRGHECRRANQDDGDAEAGSHSSDPRCCPAADGKASEESSASATAFATLLRRLAQVEEQLSMATTVSTAPAESSDRQNEETNAATSLWLGSPQDTVADAEPRRSRPVQGQDPIWDGRSAFAGESSTSYSLDQVEDRLERLGVDRPVRAPSPPAQPLTPSPGPMTPEQGASAPRTEWRRDGGVRQLLRSNGVAFDRERWEVWLSSFFAEVHPLYPFLHPPAVWEELTKMWNISLACGGVAENDLDLKLAQVFLTLAIGCCQTATRSASSGRHSAGWSLYCVATKLTGDVLNLCSHRASPLLQLQTLCLMVVYLFRLDANERAQNVLALAVSHAHSLGINRNATLENMPHFQNEMLRRVWWCIYVLDRRLCLETGRPFFILDLNSNTELPSNVSDVWLSAHRFSQNTTSDIHTAIVKELQRNSCSSVSYLKAMIEYSRIVGKVWESMYTAPFAKQTLSDYIEVLLDHWLDTLPPTLVYDGNAKRGSQELTITRTVMFQRFLLYLRNHYVRLMIRKPVLQPATNDVESNFICISLAHTIIEAFLQAPPTWGVLKFPCLQYLLGATTASLSLLITEPTLRPRYAKATISAANMLKRSCYESWVSAKTARAIARLDAVVRSILSSYQAQALASLDLTAAEQAPSKHREVTRYGRNAQQERLYSMAFVGEIGNQMSPPFRQRGSGVAQRETPPSSGGRRDVVPPTKIDTERNRQPGARVQVEQHNMSAADFTWPDVSVEELDFERLISDGGFVDSATDHLALMPWNGGTTAWLDRLFDTTSDTHLQQPMHIDPNYLTANQRSSHSGSATCSF